MSNVLRVPPRGPHAVGRPSRTDEESEGLTLEAAIERLFEEHMRETAAAAKQRAAAGAGATIFKRSS
jgi:hypothetical protein